MSWIGKLYEIQAVINVVESNLKLLPHLWCKWFLTSIRKNQFGYSYWQLNSSQDALQGELSPNACHVLHPQLGKSFLRKIGKLLPCAQRTCSTIILDIRSHYYILSSYQEIDWHPFHKTEKRLSQRSQKVIFLTKGKKTALARVTLMEYLWYF